MHSNRTLRVTLLSVILVLGSFTAFIIAPTVGAEESNETTTLYFHNIGGFAELDENFPTNENDSFWPPDLLSEPENFLLWAFMVFQPLLFNETEEYMDDPFFGMFNPFKVSAMYYPQGDNLTEIKGDIKFDLYFKSPLPSKFLRKDDLKVAISFLDIENMSMEDFNIPFKEINTTIRINPKIFGKIQKYEVTIENVSHKLGVLDQMILFSVEVIPKNKFIGWLIDREKIREKVIEFLPRIKELRDTVKDKIIAWVFNKTESSENEVINAAGEILQMLRDVNISSEYLAEIANFIRSSSFVFDSIEHPSSVTVPLTIPNDTENTKVFYLHDGEVMDTSQPAGTEQKLPLETTPTIWNGQTLGDRNKIINKITANLYFKKFLGKKQVQIILYDNDENTEIASSTQEVGPSLGNEPTIFTFNDLNYELGYGHKLNLGVALANGSRPGIFKTKLLYDSDEHPSSVTITFTETDNIQFELTSDPENELIIPGDELKYTLSIESNYDDEIDVDISEDKTGDWSYSIVETLPISIKAGETEEINVIVKSENNKNEAYGDTIDLTFVVSGKTGIDKKTTTAIVDQEAIEYNIGLYGQDESKNIKKGKSGTFYFVIENKNTGADDDVDSYTITASSKNDWELKYTDSTSPLEIDEKTDSKRIFVKVYVPKNTTLDSDVITVTVTSDSNPEAFSVINVTVNVLGASIFESIIEFFKSAANSLGFDEIFGSNAPLVLAGILLIIIVLIIAILMFLLRRKSVNIICTERVQEIDPSEEAVFDITLQNPTKKTKTYEITSKEDPPSTKWQTATDREKVTIAARSSEAILLVVKPVEMVKSNDWTEVKLNVKVVGKKKSEEITTMVMVKEGKTLLRIKDVFSWPKEFKKGDRVTTSFKLENTGSISARNVQVVLFINGKEKNKVEVTIPSGGYADIKIPWIALKGKNELQLKAIEQ